MDVIELIVDDENESRLDVFLAEELNEVSRSFVQKLIKNGNVKVNDKIVKPKYILKEGDFIKVILPKPKELKLEPENIPIEIIYEDDDIAIVNKPQDMVVHPAPGNYSGTLVNALLYHLKNLSNINGIIRPGIVHRIDKDTSGLLMIAKTNLAHIELSKQLKEHSINRRYLTLVNGNIKQDNGTIDAPIGRHPINRKKMAVTKSNSKHAVTHFTVIERFKQYTLLEVRLETGRTHQIRVHMNYIKHPVVGDKVYGTSKCEFNLIGQLLHAKTIGFIHPRFKRYMEFNSDIPNHFQKVLDVLRKRSKNN